jgi:hypothetical protein
MSKVFLEFPTDHALGKRLRVITAIAIALPVLAIVFTEIMLFVDPTFLNGDFFGHEVDRLGILYGESISIGGLFASVVVFLTLCVIHLVYYIRGYDKPQKPDLIKANITSDDANYTMVTAENFSALGSYLLALWFMLLVLTIVQGVIYGLWKFHPLAVLLPIVIAAAVTGVRHLRTRARNRKLSEQEIIERLNGTHQAK